MASGAGCGFARSAQRVEEVTDSSLPLGVVVLPLSVHAKSHVSATVWGILLLCGAALVSLPVLIAVVNGASNAGCAAPCIIIVGLVGVFLIVVGAQQRRGTKGTLGQRKCDRSHISDHLHKLHWPRARSGARPAQVEHINAVVEQGVRVVVDTEVASWVRGAKIQHGLIEPTPVVAADPAGTWWLVVSTILLLVISLALVPGVFFLASMAGGTMAGIVAGGILLILVVGSAIRQYAPLQRKCAGIPVLGLIIRKKVGRGGLVVGPGWARAGRIVWHTKRDLLLIRRCSGLKARTGIQLMFAGRPGRLCFMLAGTEDPMLEMVWQAWMHPEPRPELASSELAGATR